MSNSVNIFLKTPGWSNLVATQLMNNAASRLAGTNLAEKLGSAAPELFVPPHNQCNSTFWAERFTAILPPESTVNLISTIDTYQTGGFRESTPLIAAALQGVSKASERLSLTTRFVDLTAHDWAHNHVECCDHSLTLRLQNETLSASGRREDHPPVREDGLLARALQPVHPFADGGRRLVQPLSHENVIQAVTNALTLDGHHVVDAVGPQVTERSAIQSLTEKLGRPFRPVNLPTCVADPLARLDPVNFRYLSSSNVREPLSTTPFAKLLGSQPIGLEQIDPTAIVE